MRRVAASPSTRSRALGRVPVRNGPVSPGDVKSFPAGTPRAAAPAPCAGPARGIPAVFAAPTRVVTRRAARGTPAALEAGEHDARRRGDAQGPGPARDSPPAAEERSHMTLVRFLPGRSRDLTSLRTEMDQLFESIFSNRPIRPRRRHRHARAAGGHRGDRRRRSSCARTSRACPRRTSRSAWWATRSRCAASASARPKRVGHVHRTERMLRRIRAHVHADLAGARATRSRPRYRDGVLEIRVPKAEEARVREIEVQVG